MKKKILGVYLQLVSKKNEVKDMEIKYWSDIACPFCYIGSNNMKKALKDLDLQDKVPLKFLSYQLDPNAPTTAPKSSDNSTLTPRMKQIEDFAHQNGLEMNLAKVIHVNSMDAHRLIKLAYTKNDETANKLINELYRLYFVAGKSIADHEVLKNAGIKAGLVASEIDDVLNTDKFEKEVKQDEMAAAQLGVQGVPFFIINNKYAINGAQPYDVLVNALKKIEASEDDQNGEE
ncbi:DsbA family oxidoreductase [Lactobacillus paragasseri]|nr:DsbA family oxidoreductase [Lactobacillus paragasseri]UWI46946.1 DsbA family oxidoreductase [Lactobacillus paragasseri]